VVNNDRPLEDVGERGGIAEVRQMMMVVVPMARVSEIHDEDQITRKPKVAKGWVYENVHQMADSELVNSDTITRDKRIPKTPAKNLPSLKRKRKSDPVDSDPDA
jgi:hypothetical protein